MMIIISNYLGAMGVRVVRELWVTSTIFAIQPPIIGSPPALDNIVTRITDTKAKPSVTPFDQKNPFINPSLIKFLNLVIIVHCIGIMESIATQEVRVYNLMIKNP